MTASAETYLLTKGLSNNAEIRFDAIAISPNKESDLDCTINWIKNILV
jgi:Holliday junction resolvase-like predicted endonuclease